MVYTERLIKLDDRNSKKIKVNRKRQHYIYIGVLINLETNSTYKFVLKDLKELNIDYQSNKVFMAERIHIKEFKDTDRVRDKIKKILDRVKEEYKNIDFVEI